MSRDEKIYLVTELMEAIQTSLLHPSFAVTNDDAKFKELLATVLESYAEH